MAGRLQGGALCLPRAALAARMDGHLVQLRAVKRTASSLTSGPDAWQRPGSSRAARCVSLGGFGRAGGRYLVPASGSQEDGQTGRQRATTGPQAGRLAGARRLQGGALRLPGRPWPGGRAGTWSRLRAVRRTARRADSGSPEGHGADAWQGADASRAARYTSLGVPGRAGGRHLVTTPGGQEDG